MQSAKSIYYINHFRIIPSVPQLLSRISRTGGLPTVHQHEAVTSQGNPMGTRKQLEELKVH